MAGCFSVTYQFFYLNFNEMKQEEKRKKGERDTSAIFNCEPNLLYTYITIKN